MQMFVASADLMAAASVLYFLLPAEITVSYPKFLGMFLTAQVAGIASHVPGGLGVVEAVLLLTLTPQDPAVARGVDVRVPIDLLPVAFGAGHDAVGRARRSRAARGRDPLRQAVWPLGPLHHPPRPGRHDIRRRRHHADLRCLAQACRTLALGRGLRAAAGCRAVAVIRQRGRHGTSASGARPGRASGNCLPPIDSRC